MTNQSNQGSSDVSKEKIKKAWEDVVLKKKTAADSVRKEILTSWIRCVEIGVDPLASSKISPATKNETERLLQKYNDLIKVAEPVIDMIEISVRGTGFIVTLAEKNGRVLIVRGDSEVMDMAARNGYLPGCVRSTEAAGTNAIGICLDEGKPFQLTGAEHYRKAHHNWTCSSAPVRDPSGNLIGAITLSGPSIGRHEHTLALVIAGAKRVEGQLRELDLVENTQRLNTILSTIYNSVSDGFIALDHKRIVTHLNSAACKMLETSQESAFGSRIEDLAVLESGFADALFEGGYQENCEISFKVGNSQKQYICRVDPIRSPTHKLLGNIVIMTAPKQVMNIAKQIGGNYAKFEFADIKGKNKGFIKQIDFAKLAAKTNSRVLILGKSGTGKELFAQAIHNASDRKKGPFVAVSCAAIPRDLIESELFGYQGGAFTGARQKGMIGKFELANGGTLFLDEINGMPLDLQGKLLRALQQNEIMRLGDTRTIPVDVRVIAASNTDLMEEVENENFREDLYYRLNVWEIIIPVLKERIDDVKLLAEHIVAQSSRKMGIQEPGIDSEAMHILSDYDWPGNVRELENVLERAILLCHGDTITADHLLIRTRKKNEHIPSAMTSIDEVYKEMIAATLDRCNGNISSAAKELNIARATLYRKMEQFGLRK